MPENEVYQRIAELAMKWRVQELTPEERVELDRWYAGFDDGLLEVDAEETVEQLEQRLYAAIAAKAGLTTVAAKAGLTTIDVPLVTRARRVRLLWPRFAVAAAVLFMAVGVCVLVRQHHLPKTAAPVADVAPGGNKAVLTLAGGQKIILSTVKNGRLAREGGAEIEKTADGVIRYDVTGAGVPLAAGDSSYNTISTPRGGQYAVTLSDGTKVVLNAASSIRYPAVFAGKTRSVELTGEAWFDVARDARHPFYVRTRLQDLEVLGTQFDLDVYDDEPGTRTTLLAGSVSISDKDTHRSGILKPGQQAILEDQNLSFVQADTGAAVAWKNGYFLFHSEDITSIMRKLARWYAIDVVYSGPKPDALFNGSIQQLVNISQVLKKLELTNKVHFKIEGRTITVSR